jgi:hypothetical protein
MEYHEVGQTDVGQTTGPAGIRGLLDRLITRLFAAEDERARDRGWQVRRTAHGFGRSYRDPRWDRISACESCAELSENPGCPLCTGTGVIRLDETAPETEPEPLDSWPRLADPAGTEVA